jgi:hypothetical protein
MSVLEAFEEFEPVTARLPTLDDFPIVGIHEYFARQIPLVPEALSRRRLAGLQVAMHLTAMGVLDSTPRVHGATDEGELLIFPHFKPRTMPRLDVETRKQIDREIQLGLRGKDEDNAERTKFGLWLAKRSLDDAVPIPSLIGMYGIFGNARPIMPAELFSVGLIEAAKARGMSALDVARAMRPGYATNYAWLGARTWNPEKFVEAVTLTDEQQPTKRQLLRAVTSKEFRQQTGSPQVLVAPEAA